MPHHDQHPSKCDTSTIGATHGTTTATIRTHVSLKMGLRSFLKRKLNNDEGSGSNQDGDGDSSSKMSDSAVFGKGGDADEEAMARFEGRQSRLATETAQERIRRVNQGQMSEDEKIRFMESLNERDRIIERRKRGKPIRQDLPLSSRGKNSSSGSSNKVQRDETGQVKYENESPTSLLASVLSKAQRKGNQATSQSVASTGNSLTSWSAEVARQHAFSEDGEAKPMNERAKEAWLNMVTDPNRFNTFTSVAATSKNPPSNVNTISRSQDETMIKEEGYMEDDKETKEELVEEMADEAGVGEESLLTEDISSSVNLPEVEEAKLSENDLASRLERAALLQAERDMNTRKLKEEQEKKNLQLQQEEQRRLEARQRERDELFRKKEEEAIAKRKSEEEARQKEQEKLNQIAEERRKELMAAQDLYWKKKVEREKVKRDEQFSQKKQPAPDPVAAKQHLWDRQSEQAKIIQEEADRLKQMQKEREKSMEAERFAAEERAKALMEASAAKIIKEKEEQAKEARKRFNERKEKQESIEGIRISPPSLSSLTNKSTIQKKESPVQQVSTPMKKSIRQPIPAISNSITKPIRQPITTEKAADIKKPVRQQLPLTGNQGAAKKPIRQQLPIQDGASPIKKPIRQTLPLSGDEKEEDRPEKKKLEFSDDARKKAQTFGINLDLLNN